MLVPVVEAPVEYVRRAAVRLRRAGVAAEIVMDALRVEKWTLAGWLSHDSRIQKKLKTELLKFAQSGAAKPKPKSGKK